MKEIISALQRYLLETLNVKVKLSPWDKKNKLPFFLANSYDFYETLLLNQKCLFVVSKSSNGISPATIKNHFKQIQKISNKVGILIQATTASYNRKRLIEHQIPFIIPGNQMYLPELGIDLREYFKSSKEEKKTLSPAAQTLLISVLLSENSEPVTPSQLLGKMGYTLMTKSRVFNELESAGIGKFYREGKERLLKFEENKKELWVKVKDLLRNPIKKRLWAKGKKPKILAGLSALAEETLLISPAIPVYAVSYEEWKKMDVTELADQEEAAFELEIWYYDPALFAKDGCVDPYSLYLSLCETEDERVEAALEVLMEKTT